MLKTLITFGWLGDFGKLRNAAKKNKLAKCLYRLYVEKHQSYIPLYADLSDDIWFPHLTGIHIAGATHIGLGCTIYQHVTIGSNHLEGTKHPGAPTIGNNVLIGAGARIVGGVKIGDNSHVGAGCVVVDDVPANSVVVMNKPRVIIKNQIC